MKKSVSPFAALTCQEKHLKWLEYQSMQLPYTKAAVDREPIAAPAAANPEKKADPPQEKKEEPRRMTPAPQAPVHSAPARHTPSAPAMDMRPKHRQYDAVIARMKQAEMRTQSYTSVN